MNSQQKPEYSLVQTDFPSAQQPTQHTVVPYTHSSGYAIASLILGILSSALACLPILPTFCGLLGILFVMKTRKRDPLFQNGVVTAGLILSICGFLFSLFCLAYWIWYIWIFLQVAEPHREIPPPMPKYHGKPAIFLWSSLFFR